jgi:hypothetical protein
VHHIELHANTILTGLKGKTGMVEKMHKATSNGIIVATTWRDVGMAHVEQDII